MSDPVDPWHFARPELASRYLNAFDLGLVSARGLFARRRMGKSEFLKHDLLPAAQAAGYVAAYTNLWDDTKHPGQAIAAAILSAVEPKGLARFWQELSTPVRKVKAGAKAAGIEGGVEFELAHKEQLAVPAIQAALQAADKAKKRLLLVLDEAQVLASTEHKQIAYSLRSGLDIRKASIKVLFAGSSEAALRDMFSRASEPFYNWAPVEPFPLLGEEFVRATVARIKQLAKLPLPLQDALQAFHTLNDTPEFFRWFVERYLLYQEQGAQAALEHTLGRVHNDGGYAKTWKGISRTDRAVLLLAAQGVQDLHGAAALARLRQLLGTEVTATTPRSALRRMTAPKMQVMARIDHGTYRFEDQEFESWVRSRRTVD